MPDLPRACQNKNLLWIGNAVAKIHNSDFTALLLHNSDREKRSLGLEDQEIDGYGFRSFRPCPISSRTFRAASAGSTAWQMGRPTTTKSEPERIAS